MSNARSIVAQRSFWPNLAWAGFVASVVLQGAQSTVPVDHSAYFGAWTLNRELSPAARTPDGSEGHGRESDGRGGRGHGGGGGGFGRRGGGGGRGSGGSASFDPEEREKVMALMQELMTPTPHWVLRNADDGTVIFSDAEGRSSRFVPNDKKEKHQLTAGTVETKTKWDKGQLRQEFSLPAGLKAVRVFAVIPETKQLTVTTTMEGGAAGQRPPFRVVYDRDEP